MSALATALYTLGHRLYHFFLDIGLATIPQLTFRGSSKKEPADRNDEGVLTPNKALSLFFTPDSSPRLSSNIVQGLGLILLIVLFILILKKFWIDPIFRDFEEAENDFVRKRREREARRPTEAEAAPGNCGGGTQAPLLSNGRLASPGSNYFCGQGPAYRRFHNTIVTSYGRPDHSVLESQSSTASDRKDCSVGEQQPSQKNAGTAAASAAAAAATAATRWVNQCLVNITGGLNEARDGFLTKWMTAMNDRARKSIGSEINEARVNSKTNSLPS